VGDGDGVVRVGQLADALQMRLFALGHALVLAEVVVPESDDEFLEYPAGVARVVPGPPGDRAGAPAAAMVRVTDSPARTAIRPMMALPTVPPPGRPSGRTTCRGP
jgi:hypothetical protein